MLFLSTSLGCTDSYLKDERRSLEVPVDRSVSLQGELCTPPPEDTNRPLKVFFAIDGSQSMAINDPDQSRGRAVVDLLRSLPRERELEFTVMVFADSTTAFLTRSGENEFESILTYDETDLDILREKIIRATEPNSARGATDFVKPMAQIFQLIHDDIYKATLNRAASPARYSVIFLTDGRPTNLEQDTQLLCGDNGSNNVVRRIRELKDRADDVELHTIHVFRPRGRPDSTTCRDTGMPPPAGSACLLPLPASACPLQIVSQNVERLQRMATLGGGNFRDFQNDEPINFVGLVRGQVRRSWVLESVVASNLSAVPGSNETLADSDSDGLLDGDEARAGTDPFVVDTDGDGFSDGVEAFFASRGAPLRPRVEDTGCPMELRRVDADCDAVLDCDEQFIGSNPRRADTDGDGVADLVEFQHGTNPALPDADEDPDNDGVPNRLELERHTDPFKADTLDVSVTAYRTELTRKGLDETGRTCWNVRIDNVLLANTLADGRPTASPERRLAGLNDLLLSATMRSGDDASGKPLTRLFRATGPRFPVGGIRSPPDGVIHFTDTQVTDACLAGPAP